MHVDLFGKELRVGDNVVYAEELEKELCKGKITQLRNEDDIVIDLYRWRKPKEVVSLPKEDLYPL